MIVTDERVARFVGERIQSLIVPPYTTMGIERNGIITAGVVFNCFTGNDVEVTIAGANFTKGFVSAVGRYVFDALGCLRMSITTEQPNVINIALRLSAKIEGVKRNHFGVGRDAVLLGILREDWKFA